jgi:hypothetical protein
MRLISLLAVVLPLPFASVAQNWEAGASAGYGTYHNVNVNGVTTGFTPGAAFSGILGNETTRYFGGEFRYTYRRGDLKVSSGSSEAKANGQSQAIHYDFLFHTTKRESLVRPFFAAGAGIKVFQGIGSEPVYQPLSNFVVLTHTTQVEPLISVGGGVKVMVSHHALIRFDFRDYATPLPYKLLASPGRQRISGWVHDLVGLVGVSAVF